MRLREPRDRQKVSALPQIMREHEELKWRRAQAAFQLSGADGQSAAGGRPRGVPEGVGIAVLETPYHVRQQSVPKLADPCSVS
jgi:hypothetical protein